MMQKRFVPEVLAPAGNLEKLKVAINYGANAVYASGQKFGLRTAADNFSYGELKEGVEFAHDRGANIYITLNGFLHDKDLAELGEFVRFLESISIDAVIVSDLGVLTLVQKESSLPIHLSTQASCLNIESAKFWKSMGVKRIVLGREVSVSEAGKIKKGSGLEVELFIHGSMCMAYSGNCVISNYTRGRDSNRGGCAHSCRFEYQLDFAGKDSKPTNEFFMSSKDLMGIKALPSFIEHEIDSVKIEGRMKSNLYAGTTAKIYSEAIANFRNGDNPDGQALSNWENELKKVVHRDFSEGNLLEKAGARSIYDERIYSDLNKGYPVIGDVVELVGKEHAIVLLKNNLDVGDQVEIMLFAGKSESLLIKTMTNILGEPVIHAKPNTLVKIPYVDGVEVGNIVRKGMNRC